MTAGALTTIDEAAVLDEVAQQCAAVDREQHRADREFATALESAVGDWFIRRYGL